VSGLPALQELALGSTRLSGSLASACDLPDSLKVGDCGVLGIGFIDIHQQYQNLASLASHCIAVYLMHMWLPYMPLPCSKSLMLAASLMQLSCAVPEHFCCPAAALSLGLPPSLQVLDLAYNRLEGPLPGCLLNRLHELFLPGNALSGSLPAPAATSPLTTLYANAQRGEGLTGGGRGLQGDRQASTLGLGQLLDMLAG
jgi:hypothetical protein